MMPFSFKPMSRQMSGLHQLRPVHVPFLGLPMRQYSQVTRKTPIRHKKTHSMRYLFGVVLLSFGLLHFVSSRIDKKQPKTTFTEREFDQYEKETGLRRRHKLITSDSANKYDFYVVPFARSPSKAATAIEKSISSERPVKVINPADLIEKEIQDEGRYSYLLEEIKKEGRSMPPGLLTALVKQEINLFLNTTKGQYDTDILLMNYPQSTEEAIKFENDISDIKSCIVLKDTEESLDNDLNKDDLRKINNIYGYFSIVDKVTKL